MKCVECSRGHKNWWKFAIVGFVPLTNFYFLIVFLNINVTSSRLHGLVLFSQVVSAPALIRLTFVAIKRHQSLLKVVKITEPFYSLWNLDIFRLILPDICLKVSTLGAFALDACIAVYPMILWCMELHICGYLCIM